MKSSGSDEKTSEAKDPAAKSVRPDDEALPPLSAAMDRSSADLRGDATSTNLKQPLSLLHHPVATAEEEASFDAEAPPSASTQGSPSEKASKTESMSPNPTVDASVAQGIVQQSNSLPLTIPSESKTLRTRQSSPSNLPRPPSLRQSSKASSSSSMRGIVPIPSREAPTGPEVVSSDSFDFAAEETEDLLRSLQQQPLPTPKETPRCPLFCCFYAEFDNIVGPKVSFQSPLQFMDHRTSIQMNDIHTLLEEAFERIRGQHDTGRVNETIKHDGAKDLDLSTDVEQEENDETIVEEVPGPDSTPDLSIFDATSEYTINGTELAGKMINLSTHSMHILTRPTVIADEKYDRNALLFSVGFVLRRVEDPRPFRPLLAKWAGALHTLEVESEFLSDPAKRPRLQVMLDRLLVSLNSPEMECNLLLDDSNWVNLKLYRTPKPPATPVHDHVVPVLIREELLNMYDWDLAIKWIVLHIDGVDNARLIATKADVDMEMARACLRVLKHHGVIAFVDMFFYSNRYECTTRATAMLAGKDQKILQEAVDFVSHRPRADKGSQDTLSSSLHQEGYLQPGSNGVNSSFPPETRSWSSSFRNAGHRIGSIAAAHELHQSASSRREHRRIKATLAELYCSCQRNIPLSEILISKIQNSHTLPLVKRDTSKPDEGPLRRPRSHSVGQSEARNKSDVYGIDWRASFKSFDHRRFATFGIVHGLLRRVHAYPFAVERADGCGRISQQNGFRHTAGNDKADKGHALATRVAAKMDGTRSDDELVSEFEMPLQELLQTVELTLNCDVMSLF